MYCEDFVDLLLFGLHGLFNVWMCNKVLTMAYTSDAVAVLCRKCNLRRENGNCDENEEFYGWVCYSSFRVLLAEWLQSNEKDSKQNFSLLFVKMLRFCCDSIFLKSTGF